MTHYCTKEVPTNKIAELSEFLVNKGFKPTNYQNNSFNRDFNPNMWTSPHIDVKVYTKRYNISIDTKLNTSSPEDDPQKQTIRKIMDILGVEELVGSIATETYNKSRFN